MRQHSEAAWDIANKFSHALASETRDLAAWIDKAMSDEREACAKLADDEAKRMAARSDDAALCGGLIAKGIAHSIRQRNNV